MTTFKYTIHDHENAVEIYYSDELLQHPDDPDAPSEYINVAFFITDAENPAAPGDRGAWTRSVSEAKQIPKAWQPV